jgi:hypothetical protein
MRGDRKKLEAKEPEIVQLAEERVIDIRSFKP